MKNYSAIKEMLRGNRGGNENFKQPSEEKIVLEELCEIENEFRKYINDNEDAVKSYNQLDKARINLEVLNLENSYLEGFRFGFLMAIDVFSYNED